MGATVTEIQNAVARLRTARKAVLLSMTSRDVAEALSVAAEHGRRGEGAAAARLKTLTEPFPFAMVQPSLDALWNSMSQDALRDLQKNEGVVDRLGYCVIGHVIAGNTPLLAWTSVIRALLVRSASLVKLPSGASARWGYAFHEWLAESNPDLARCVEMREWAGGTRDLDEALVAETDCLVAYGDDSTIDQLQSYRPRAPFVGYGHRLSMAIALSLTAGMQAGMELARDVLTYDQSGCLSPHSIYLIGDSREADEFAVSLTQALKQTADAMKLPSVTADTAAQVRRHRTLARMMGDRVWEDPELRYTVIRSRRRQFAASPTHGIINVQSLTSLDLLPDALAEVAGALQGCAVAGGKEIPSAVREMLEKLRVSYLCRPGQMQAPPIQWRQNDLDVLRSLTDAGRQTDFRGEKR